MTAPVDPPVWAPTLDDVAAVTPNYTRGGFDDDSDELGGGPHGIYDQSTLPTDAMVTSMIATACDEVAGRVGVTIPTRCYGLAKAAVKWSVAATIAAGKAPQDTDDTRSEVSQFTRNFTAALAELTSQARMGPVRLR